MAKFNDGVKYLLVVIDIFTKQCYTKVLFSKTSVEVANKFSEILEEIPKKMLKKIVNIHSDEGGEYYGAPFQKLMRKHNINHYSTYSGMKAQVILFSMLTLCVSVCISLFRWLKELF